MKEIILGLWLGTLSLLDFRDREIPIGLTLLGGLIGMVFGIWEKRDIFELVLSCLPGCLAMVFAWVSKETIGYGDGLVLIIMGIYLPISNLLSIGLQAIMIAGVVALVLLVVFHKRGSYRLPFIPFLGLAYGCESFIQWGKL